MRSENTLSEIALWGPTGSGKTWLISAFAQSLELLNSKNSNYDFSFVLTDGDGNQIYGYPPVPPPTQGFEDTTYFFSRVPKLKSPRHQISASVHRIVIHDDKGGSLLELTTTTSYSSIFYSNFVIALLDPTLVEGHRKEGFRYTSHEYATLVKTLLEQMTKNKRKEKQNIAFCISKSDTIGASGDSYHLLERHFGSEMSQVIHIYKQQMNIELFSVSSAGNIKQNVGIISNFDPQSGTLRDISKWMPYGVTSPFFWFFETIERERIKMSAKGLSGILYGKKREEMYIPYPTPKEGLSLEVEE
jgi:hypothetical protein